MPTPDPADQPSRPASPDGGGLPSRPWPPDDDPIIERLVVMSAAAVRRGEPLEQVLRDLASASWSAGSDHHRPTH